MSSTNLYKGNNFLDEFDIGDLEGISIIKRNEKQNEQLIILAVIFPKIKVINSLLFTLDYRRRLHKTVV